MAVIVVKQNGHIHAFDLHELLRISVTKHAEEYSVVINAEGSEVPELRLDLINQGIKSKVLQIPELPSAIFLPLKISFKGEGFLYCPLVKLLQIHKDLKDLGLIRNNRRRNHIVYMMIGPLNVLVAATVLFDVWAKEHAEGCVNEGEALKEI